VIVDDGGGLHEIRNVGGDDVANLLHDLKVKNKKIKTLFIAAHADSTVIQLRGDYILQANTSGVWIGDGHNLTDLTHDIRGLLDVGAVIQLAGCNTADGTHNHAYYMSMSFHNVSVMGSSFYTAQIPPTEYFLMNEKTYLNGGIVNTGWGFSGKP